jgi:hypothetical protein
MTPSLPESPSSFAGFVVTAASAWSSERPRAMALVTMERNVFTSFNPFAVSENVTPALASVAAFAGAACHARSSSVRTSSALASSLTSGASGKLTGTISGCLVAATSATRLYSSPPVTMAALTPASAAIFDACSTSSISSATMSTGCSPRITGWSACHARFSGTRSAFGRLAAAASASRYHLASRNTWRITAIAPISEPG